MTDKLSKRLDKAEAAIPSDSKPEIDVSLLSQAERDRLRELLEQRRQLTMEEVLQDLSADEAAELTGIIQKCLLTS